MRISNSRGSASLEAIPVSILLITLVCGILLAAYLMFARAWIQYQSEQALLLRGRGKVGAICENRLRKKLKTFLPWGASAAEITAEQDRWRVAVHWKFQHHSFRLAEELTPKGILAKKVLRW